jgi:hypothetical protein
VQFERHAMLHRTRSADPGTAPGEAFWQGPEAVGLLNAPVAPAVPGPSHRLPGLPRQLVLGLSRAPGVGAVGRVGHRAGLGMDRGRSRYRAACRERFAGAGGHRHAGDAHGRVGQLRPGRVGRGRGGHAAALGWRGVGPRHPARLGQREGYLERGAWRGVAHHGHGASALHSCQLPDGVSINGTQSRCAWPHSRRGNAMPS